MRTIGLLGGMSWQSTQTYYQLINEGVQAQKGGLHSAPLLVYSFDFAEIEALQATGQWDQAGRMLARQAAGLEAGGAEAIALATNTMHKLADYITEAVSVPLLHIADATAEAILASPSRQPLLLATAFTMEQDFYTKPMAGRLASAGGAVHVPGPERRQLVHEIIYNELCVGMIRPESRIAYQDVITAEAEERGCDSVILGCTEIGLLISQADTTLPVFDTTALHCEQIVRFICGEAG